jgi:hypothetical protein
VTRGPGGQDSRQTVERTEKQIICIRTPPADLENLYQVKELAVDVAHNCHRCADVYNIAFAHQQLFRLGAYGLDDRFGEKFLLVEARDALVEIDGSW